MLKQIQEFFARLLTGDSFQSNLESYIVSHNPQSVADIDRLEREYMEKRYKGFGYFG